ncbi:MAG: nucleotidyltransferase domain-containing protein, partial [Chloroflexi bacterium]|nr:nucleotidyltransferase domain-containing protein [Chloroflexota bacterium]
VARGEARKDSDIDVLIVSRDPNATRKRVSGIRSAFDREYDYRFLIPVTYLSEERFFWLEKNGSPFLAEVMRDGVVLYDDGTFARVLEGTARAS